VALPVEPERFQIPNSRFLGAFLRPTWNLEPGTWNPNVESPHGQEGKPAGASRDD
jgi:hypothetical protein